MPEVIAVIPVRYGAQRFPGKPLAKILNKPMVQWVVEGVSQSQLISRIIIATDDERIASACASLPVQVVMTDSSLPSGSDRVYQACKNEPEDLVINIQGDEPLIDGAILDKMAHYMRTADDWDVVTFGRTITPEALASSNTAKIVLNQQGKALYFSRFAIPYSREKNLEDMSGCLKHIGIYGYKKTFLKKFCESPVNIMEKMEGLEQLRALYLGAQIQVLQVNYESWSVDTPEDLVVVENLLRKKNG